MSYGTLECPECHGPLSLDPDKPIGSNAFLCKRCGFKTTTLKGLRYYRERIEKETEG